MLSTHAVNFMTSSGMPYAFQEACTDLSHMRVCTVLEISMLCLHAIHDGCLMLWRSITHACCSVVQSCITSCYAMSVRVSRMPLHVRARSYAVFSQGQRIKFALVVIMMMMIQVCQALDPVSAVSQPDPFMLAA